MSALKSTGLANYTAVTGSLRAALNGGILYIYSGPVPASADNAIDGSSVELAKITVGDDGTTGLTFEATASGGVLTKTAAESWQGTVEATGTATFMRFVESGQSGATSSTTIKRIQDTVGTSALNGLVLTTAALTSGNTQQINLFQIY